MMKFIKSIDWNIFWNAASAIATTAAVIVALWQTRYTTKKKLKLDFVENMTIVPTGMTGKVLKNQYVGLNVSNTGNRKIIIRQFFIELPQNYRAVIQPDITLADAVKLPIELDIEESVFLPWSKEKFLLYLQQEKSIPRNKKITFCVADSTGIIYRCKTRRIAQQYLDNHKS